MNRVKKFLNEHKEAVILTTATVAITSCSIAIAFIIDDRRSVVGADFDPYNSETDPAAILNLHYKNGKTSKILFETSK